MTAESATRAWFSCDLRDLLAADDDVIVGRLTTKAASIPRGNEKALRDWL